MKVDADDGRVYLPKDTRDKYGTEFRMIETEEGILLIPIAENPLERLRELTFDTEKSSKELVEEAREYMIEQAGK